MDANATGATAAPIDPLSFQLSKNLTTLNLETTTTDYYSTWNGFISVWWEVADYFQWVSCIPCVIGSVLTLGTICRNKQFSDPCFICYRAIAVLIFIYAFQNHFFYLVRYKPQVTANYIVPWLEAIPLRGLQYSVVDGARWLMVFLSLQRAIACLLPTKFHLISGRRVCLVVTIGTILVTTALRGQYFFDKSVIWNNVTGTYSRVYNSFHYSKYFQTYNSIYSEYYMAIEGLAILISSLLAVAGMLKAASSRRQLFRQEQQNDTNARAIKKVNRNLHLCALQLSQAIPVSLTCILYFVCTQWFMEDRRVATDITWAIWQYVETFAHFYHFYFYIVFSQSFRQGFLNRIRRKTQVQPY